MPNTAVFITGAAAGIGRATALTFAKMGYTVGGYDIDGVGLKSLADEVDQLRGTAITGHLDVTDSGEMAQRVTDTFLRWTLTAARLVNWPMLHPREFADLP